MMSQIYGILHPVPNIPTPVIPLGAPLPNKTCQLCVARMMKDAGTMREYASFVIKRVRK